MWTFLTSPSQTEDATIKKMRNCYLTVDAVLQAKELVDGHTTDVDDEWAKNNQQQAADQVEVASTYAGPSLRRAASSALLKPGSAKKPRSSGAPSVFDENDDTGTAVSIEAPCNALSPTVLQQVMSGSDRRGHLRRRAREKAREWIDTGDQVKKAAADALYERLDLCDFAERLADGAWVATCALADLENCHELVKYGVEFPNNVLVAQA